jgi:hypothetical protein
MGAIPRGDDLTHAGRIKRLEEMVAELSRRDTVIADPAGVPRDVILLNDVTVPAVQAAITDGLPPASSPAAEVIGGIGSLFIRWAPVANANPVTYKVYVDTTTGFTEGPGNLVGQTSGTSMTVRTLTAGTALAYGTTYYAKIVASDADGSALAGVEGFGSMLQVDAPDIAVGAITATKLSADAIDGKVITGALIRTAVTGRRTEIGTNLAHMVALYTGRVEEVEPGLLVPSDSSTELQLALSSPTIGGGRPGTRVMLAAGIGVARDRFQVASQDIALDGAVTVSGVPVATTTDTQTLTNKDLSSATNTFPTIPTPTVQIFTASATWTKPTGLKAVRVRVIGGGGAGGWSTTTVASQGSAGGGGGGGEYAEAPIPAASLAATVAVTAGAAGVASAGNGGASSFGAHVIANGGSGGGNCAAFNAGVAVGGSGGTGGAGSVAVIFRRNGADGDNGRVQGGEPIPSRGGSSGLAYGAGAQQASTISVGGPGQGGQTFGGGGSGGICRPSHTGQSGGNGATGGVLVECFF